MIVQQRNEYERVNLTSINRIDIASATRRGGLEACSATSSSSCCSSCSCARRLSVCVSVRQAARSTIRQACSWLAAVFCAGWNSRSSPSRWLLIFLVLQLLMLLLLLLVLTRDALMTSLRWRRIDWSTLASCAQTFLRRSVTSSSRLQFVSGWLVDISTVSGHVTWSRDITRWSSETSRRLCYHSSLSELKPEYSDWQTVAGRLPALSRSRSARLSRLLTAQTGSACVTSDWRQRAAGKCRRRWRRPSCCCQPYYITCFVRLQATVRIMLSMLCICMIVKRPPFRVILYNNHACVVSG